MAKFIAADGEQLPLLKNTGPLGRDHFRSLVTPDNADLISREHLRIESENGSFYLEDAGSTNGTKINGSKITGKGRFPIKDGDIIDLASVLTLTFQT